MGLLQQERNDDMAIYLKNDKIPGNTTTEGFKNQIELNSATFGSGRSMGMSKRSDANRGHAEPHLSEISVSKQWDAIASAKLMENSIAGVGDHKVTISFTTTSKNTVLAFMTFDLEDVVISSYSIGCGGDAQPSESFNLNYTKITITTFEVKDGKATKKDVVVYSLPEMKANG
jgi:type VI secretion system secreted protein Hcp